MVQYFGLMILDEQLMQPEVTRGGRGYTGENLIENVTLRGTVTSNGRT